MTDHGQPYGIDVDWRTLGEYFSRLESQGVSVNVASYVGATQVRMCVLGSDSREPTADEMAQMKSLVTEAMRDGALGLSSALLVPPNTYLTIEQLVAMASAAGEYGGIYSTHIRSEGIGIEEAILEAIEIGEKAEVPVDIIHLKIADRRLWGRMPEITQLIEAARSRGLAVTANQYPYPAGQNNLVALIPPWAMEGGRQQMLNRLKDPSQRERMKADILNGIDGWFNHYLAMEGWEGCRVASVSSEGNNWCEGKSIAEISEKTGKDPTDVVFDLLLEEGGSVPAVYFLMSEDDIRYAMQLPWVSFGSDGTAVRPDGPLGQGKPHPRWYGTFPRVLGRYVREEQVLTLEQAVRKMTRLNAEKLGLEDRGLLAVGKKADITIFDPATVIDRATFEDPHQYAEGILYVIVNGEEVLRQGKHLETRPGRILRRHGS
jgi:N-acyl-D-aspartate/D-glutamate deacylase